MPALVNSSVGSFAGRSGLERTRVWPWRSKYCKNFSRISFPVMIEWSLARETAAPKTTFPQPQTDCRFERVVSWLPADGIESVPGAIATGSQLTPEIGVDAALTRSLPLPVLTSSIKLRHYV